MKAFAFPTRRRSVLLMALAAATVLLGLAVYWHMASSALMPAVFIQTQGGLDSVEFSGDGRLLMTVDQDDRLVTFRDAKTGQVVRQWPGGAWRTWLSGDGLRFLDANNSPKGPTRCALRDAVTGRALRQWTGQILDVLPDLSLMVAADDYRTDLPFGHGRAPATGRVVEVASGRVVGRFAMSDLWGVRLSRDGRYLCLPGDTQPSRLLRLPNLSSVLSLPPLNSLRVSRDGVRAFGVSQEGALHLWLLPSGRHTSIATGLSHARWAYALADGMIGIDGEQGTPPNAHSVIQVRSADGTRLLRSLTPTDEAFSGDGRIIATGIWEGHGETAFDVLDVPTGRRVARLDTATDALGQPLSPNNPARDHLAIAPDGRRFAYATGDGLLRLYDLAASGPSAPRAPVSTDGGRSVLSFPSNDYGASVFDAVALPGGGVAASGGADVRREQRQVQVWRPGKDVLMVKAVVGNGNVSRLGVSPDGRLLAGSSQWGVWTLDLAHVQSAATPITVATDGTRYYSTEQEGRPVWLDGPGQPFTVVSAGMFGNGPVLLTRWDAVGRKIGSKTLLPSEEMVEGHNYQVGAVEASPDGKTLAVLWNGLEHRMEGGKRVNEMMGDGMMELRDTRTGRLLRTLLATRRGGLHPSYPGALGQPTFSPDGRLLAVGDDRGRVLVFDVAAGHKIGQMSGTRALNTGGAVLFASNMFGGTARLAFAPDGRFLAAARDDGSIYLYSLRTFLPVAQIGETSAPAAGGYGQTAHPLRWMAFDARGGTLYGIAQNGTDVLAWDVPNVPDAPTP